MKKPIRAAAISATPAKANVRGPPKIPKKNDTTPNTHSSEPSRPAVFDKLLEFSMPKR